jgi:hypothetical protein
VPEQMHTEFASIIGCQRCSLATCPCLLRDNFGNVPQPGYVGANYARTCVAFVGQNPGEGNRPADAARAVPYTAALRDAPTPDNYARLHDITGRSMAEWLIHAAHFPLKECGLELADIAYFNLVWCRTIGNAAPDKAMVEACRAHFARWLYLLKPSRRGLHRQMALRAR